MINALKADRLPHALLLTGPRGTGKTSTARILSKYLRCPNIKNFEPCLKCSECDEISSGRAMNVIEIDGASNNGVDAIRELRDSVGYSPSNGKYKIYIIDEVHMLSGSAFNALLKTLEEPPAHVIFIMATTEVQKIPNTILSRCQRYDFRRISTQLIAEHLSQICKAEKIKAENEALWAIARQGDGSMRDSQSLLDQTISFSGGHLTLKNVTEVLGLTDRQMILDTVKGLIERNTSFIANSIESLFLTGHDPHIFLKDLIEELRHLLLIKTVPEKADRLVDLSQEEIKSLKELSKNLSQEDIHLLFDMALKGSYDMQKSQDARVVLEMVMMRMAAAPRIRNIMNFISATSAPATMTENAATASQPEFINTNLTASSLAKSTLSSADEKWLSLLEKIKNVNGVVAAKIEHMHVLKLTDTAIELGIPDQYKFLSTQVNDSAFKKKVANYITTFWGQTLEVSFKEIAANKTETQSASQLTQKKTVEENKKIETDIENHPLVKSAKTIFSSKITSIKEGR